MAIDYKALTDLLNPKKEEEQLFSPMTPTQDQLMTPVNPTPEQLASIMEEQAPEPEASVQPVVNQAAPKKEDKSLTEDKNLPPAPPEMSKSEALIAEYNKLLGKGEQDLAEARKRDRMLKVGGALGDALATYLNAQSQMNVKAPGVQVQQGAGLGKVADMFATAPEIASDIALRREAMMKQYAELARGERAQARLQSEEKRADVADKRARELAQMQIEGELKAAGIRASGKGELTPYQEMMKEEKQIQKQEKDLKALKEIETRKRTIEDNIERAKAIVGPSGVGTFEMFGPESEELNSIIDEISVDMAKLQDPDSVARPNEVALVRKNLIPESAIGKLGMSNDTAIKLLDKFKERVNERAKIGYQVRGIKAPEGEEAVKPTQKQDYEPKIDKVLKANPGASRQQVIEALKKDKKLPEDYK
jgi:hypothetical protein